MRRYRNSVVRLGFAISILAVGVCPAVALENHVTVESRTFYTGQTACTVGVFFENSVGLTGIVAPLEIREIDAGAYPASAFWRAINLDSRVMQASMVCTTFCPAGYTPLRTFATPHALTNCGGPISHDWLTAAANIDYSSPDAIFLALVSMSDPEVDEDYYLRPGSDGTLRDSAILRLGFTVSQTVGSFEIDTCCVRPANHLAYVDLNTQLVVPTFTKGIITISCMCPCLHDPNCDGISTDIEDVVETINVAFRAKLQIVDPGCARPRTDFDCNGVTDVVDAVRVSLVTFYGYDRATYYCAPCE